MHKLSLISLFHVTSLLPKRHKQDNRMDLFGFYLLLFTVDTELLATVSADEVRSRAEQPRVGVADG